MFSKENKLLEALKVIRAECVSHGDDCDKCPFGTDNGVCCVNDYFPFEWNLISDKLFV